MENITELPEKQLQELYEQHTAEPIVEEEVEVSQDNFFYWWWIDEIHARNYLENEDYEF